MPIASLLLLSATLWTNAPQEPLRLGVLARESDDSSDRQFVRAARRAAALVNQNGGVDGAPLELLIAPVARDGELTAAVSQLREVGVAGLIAPPERHLAAAAAAANSDLLPMARFDDDPGDVLRVVDGLLRDRLCITRIAVLFDKTPAARDLAARLDKGPGLTGPTEVVCRFDVRTTAKKVASELAEQRPQLLLIDADPEAAKHFVDEHLQGNPLPIALTPRSYAEALRRDDREVFVVHGRSPAQAGALTAFRKQHVIEHGEPGFLAAEGFEAVLALARAFDAADSREPGKVMAKLRETALDEARGELRCLPRSDALQAPLGVWCMRDGGLTPHSPPIVPLPLPAEGEQVTTTAATRAAPAPQRSVGEPFGTWRTRDFPWEEGSQWVLLLWADDEGHTTGDADLQLLGLGTGGAAPLVDHLVKEELLARMAAITSTKFGRNADGTAIPGQSLRICFGVHLSAKERQKKKQRLWPARIGGDDEGAGGRAYGTFCRIYSTFIRRTIFQPNALVPPVTSVDRELLDGSYVFGSDPEKDRRSERIRALINAYAGSMALTLAHEVGHLATLDHVTEPATAIMNVEEGAGIDYPQATFCERSRQILEKRLGVVEAAKSRR